MPNKTDWILLNKTINNYNNNVIKIWGNISKENAHIICCNKYNGKNLFQFLLNNDHFSDANTIASYISLFNDENIQLIYDKHHSRYCEILKKLCTDKMIILYEEYYDKIHNENAGLTTEIIDSEQDIDFNNIYRDTISKRYERMLMNKPSGNIIIEIINEFKFLTHPYLRDFYNFSANIITLDYLNEFKELYGKYMDFVPLIYRLINEYYLEYIKYQLKTINDMEGNSSIIISEYYENLKKCITTLPTKYIDYYYQDRFGNNIVFYLSSLPIITVEINMDIYKTFFNKNPNIPLELINNDGNTIFHIIGYNENYLILEELLNWFFKTSVVDYSTDLSDLDLCEHNKNKITNILLIENNDGKTIFDILFDKNNYDMLSKIINYMPTKFYAKLTNKLIENFDIIDKIPSTNKTSQIYIECINYFMYEIYQMKKNILYDLCIYKNHKIKILKLLQNGTNEIDINQNYYLEWLIICIKNNEYDLFKTIMEKYFCDKKNPTILKYLNKLISYNEPIIITAIREEKILFVKYLLNYNIDLFITDKFNRSAIIVSLETKNLYLIRLIRTYINKYTIYDGMVNIMDTFIELLERHNTFNTFSIIDTFIRLWKSIEYIINYFMVFKEDTNK